MAQPTYSIKDLKELIPVLDKIGIEQLDNLLLKEKDLYIQDELLEIFTMVCIRDISLKETKGTKKNYVMLENSF